MTRSDRIPPRTRAVIFDLDGLLADTEIVDYEAWRQIYAAFGLDFPVAWWVPNVGLAQGPFDAMAPLRGLPGFDEAAVAARRRHIEEALLAKHLRPLPGATDLLAALEAAAIPCAVASTSQRQWVMRVLDRLGLMPAFQAVVSGDQVARGKPAPDVYLEAARRLGVHPTECVSLEDSMPGIAAAKAAGMRCIAVPNGLTVHHDLSAADLIVRSLEEVTVDLLTTLDGRGAPPEV